LADSDRSDRSRVSVLLVDVSPGLEPEFLALAAEFDATLRRKGYGRDEGIRDEGVPLRFYIIRHWTDADAAERCHVDAELQRLITRLYQIARVTHVINGVRRADPKRLLLADRRALIEPDRRTGFDRRVKNVGGLQGNRRHKGDRRLGPRRLREQAGDLDLIGAARRAREYADAAFSNFKVGAALETADGTVVTGCNIENASYGLTMCAERVAMFKALSEGHRAFTRIAIVADTETPTPPCGACRQILWEFGGNLEIKLGNLTKESGTHRLQDLLPLPFDARLL
jgi:cytidine deaminase